MSSGSPICWSSRHEIDGFGIGTRFTVSAARPRHRHRLQNRPVRRQGPAQDLAREGDLSRPQDASSAQGRPLRERTSSSPSSPGRTTCSNPSNPPSRCRSFRTDCSKELSALPDSVKKDHEPRQTTRSNSPVLPSDWHDTPGDPETQIPHEMCDLRQRRSFGEERKRSL